MTKKFVIVCAICSFVEDPTQCSAVNFQSTNNYGSRWIPAQVCAVSTLNRKVLYGVLQLNVIMHLHIYVIYMKINFFFYYLPRPFRGIQSLPVAKKVVENHRVQSVSKLSLL